MFLQRSKANLFVKVPKYPYPPLASSGNRKCIILLVCVSYYIGFRFFLRRCQPVFFCEGAKIPPRPYYYYYYYYYYQTEKKKERKKEGERESDGVM